MARLISANATVCSLDLPLMSSIKITWASSTPVILPFTTEPSSFVTLTNRLRFLCLWRGMFRDLSTPGEVTSKVKGVSLMNSGEYKSYEISRETLVTWSKLSGVWPSTMHVMILWLPGESTCTSSRKKPALSTTGCTSSVIFSLRDILLFFLLSCR